MKIQDLIDVSTICEAGSFRKAAQRLGISQATLSHRIDYLEQKLGAQLFVRGRGKTRATDLGRYVAEQSTELVVDAGEIMNNIQRVAEGREGLVRFGCSPAVAHAFLAEVIQEVRRSTDGLSVTSYIGTTSQLENLMAEGRIDLAICPADTGIFGAQYESTHVLEEAVHIGAVPGHPVLEDPSTYFSQPLALPVLEPAYLQATRDLFGVEMSDLSNTVYCSDYSVLFDLVSRGEFVTLGALFTFRKEIEAGRLAVVPLDDRVRHPLHLVRRHRPIALPIIQIVEDCVHRVISGERSH